MNKLILNRSLISAGLFALVGAVGAQTYYTHELVKQVAAQESAGAADTPAATLPSAPPDTASRPLLRPADDPWAAMNADIGRMQAEMDRMFQNSFSGFHRMGWPAVADEEAKVTVEEAGKDYVVKAEIPGAKETDINVNLDGRLLSISSEVKGSEKRTEGKDSHVSEEHYASSFQQAFTLPGPVSAKGMHSEFKDGVLTVTVPKAG